jgi:hypothetical protein
VDLVGPDFRQLELIRRAVEVPGEFGDGVHVAALRHRRQVADLHVFMRRRSGLISAIGAISWFRML